jgi:hypothetical protein
MKKAAITKVVQRREVRKDKLNQCVAWCCCISFAQLGNPFDADLSNYAEIFLVSVATGDMFG